MGLENVLAFGTGRGAFPGGVLRDVEIVVGSEEDSEELKRRIRSESSREYEYKSLTSEDLRVHLEHISIAVDTTLVLR